MKIEVIDKRDNPLLARTEVHFSVRYEGATPKFSDIRDELVKKLKSDPKLTIVDSVETEYGRQKANGYAKAYESEEAMNVEPAHRIKKNIEGKKTKGTPEGDDVEAAPAETKEGGESKPEEQSETKEDSDKEPAPEAGEEKPEGGEE